MTNTTKLLVVIGAGVAIGAVLGVLYAPATGNMTRKKLVKRTKKLAATLAEGVEQGKGSLLEMKSVLQEELGKVNRRIEEIRS